MAEDRHIAFQRRHRGVGYRSSVVGKGTLNTSLNTKEINLCLEGFCYFCSR